MHSTAAADTELRMPPRATEAPARAEHERLAR